VTVVDWISVVKDLLVALAAATTATVAVLGLNKWSTELRGRTRFEVSRGLMLATYRLRDELHSCRSPFVRGEEFPPEYKGPTKSTAEEERDAWAHVYRSRWKPVWEALQEYDSRALETETLWGNSIRQKTDALRQCVVEMNVAIEAYLTDKYNRGEDFRSDPNFGKEMRAVLFASRSATDNKLSQRISAAIDAVEAEVRPHIGKK
jgi:hypothetical protein